MSGVLITVAAIGALFAWRWWRSPWCAVCYRPWAWRTRIVTKPWGVPQALSVCARCARAIDER